MEFSRQEYWSRKPFPSPGDLPDPGIKPVSPTLQADFLTAWATNESSPPPHKSNSTFFQVCQKKTQMKTWINFILFLQLSISFFPSGENLNAYLSDKEFFPLSIAQSQHSQPCAKVGTVWSELVPAMSYQNEEVWENAEERGTAVWLTIATIHL